MTASPFDTANKVNSASRRLEKLLDSEIHTTSNPAMMQAYIARPKEEKYFYPPLGPCTMTELHFTMQGIIGSLPEYKKISRQALEISSELGSWVADQFWPAALQTSHIELVERRMSKDDVIDMESIDEAVDKVRRGLEFLQSVNEKFPPFEVPNFSSKVLALAQLLIPYFSKPSSTKVIVFVRKRVTALMLHKVFGAPEVRLPYLKSDVLIGSGGTANQPGDLNRTVKAQFLSVAKFRGVEVNCLFATSVGEEGLDIPDCNLVVRFDIYQTMIQYVQSRGRARRRSSRYICLVEKDNVRELETIQRCHDNEIEMRQFCKSLPSERLLDYVSPEDENFADDEVYLDPSIGATLTLRSALTKLNQFASSLHIDGPDPPSPNFMTHLRAGKYQCELIMPQGSPVRYVVSELYPKKMEAKRAAAFKACLLLRRKGYLDNNLMPVYLSTITRLANVVTSRGDHRSSQYEMMIKPTVWRNIGRVRPDTDLFFTLLDIGDGGSGFPTKPLTLVTRFRLPELAKLPIYPSDCSRAMISITRVRDPRRYDEDTVDKFTAFTLRIFQDVFSKTFEKQSELMPYWILPMVRGDVNGQNKENVDDLIDWESIRKVADEPEPTWDITWRDEDYADRFMIDIWDGSRRFFSEAIEPDLKPSDPVPEHSLVDRKNRTSIIDLSVSLWKQARLREQSRWDMSQPVLRARKVSMRLDFLSPPSEKEE